MTVDALPATLEQSPALELAAAYQTKIAYATPEALSNSLPKTGFKVRSADYIIHADTDGFELVKNSKNVTSTEADPAVIVLKGASFCALMLAKDGRGNAVGTHQSITYTEGKLSSIKQALGQMRSFFAEVVRVVKGNQGFLLLSGANPFDLDDDTQAHLEAMVTKQLRRTNLELAKLLIKPAESSYLRTDPFITKLRDVRDFFAANLPLRKSAISKNLRSISGLIYVPRQIDRGGTDRIFVMDRETDNPGIIVSLFGYRA